MKVKIINECGYDEALWGLGLSYGITSNHEYLTWSLSLSPDDWIRLKDRSVKLAKMGNGHSKFLESIQMWIDMTAPRYFWQQFDTYRIGVTKQSESTMHTLTKQPLMQSDFEEPVPDVILNHLNYLIAIKEFDALKNLLPEGFLQRRIVNLNYKSLRNIISQRISHRLPLWRAFCAQILSQSRYPQFIQDLYTEDDKCNDKPEK